MLDMERRFTPSGLRISEGEMTIKAILAELTRVAEMIDEANKNGEKII